jgi:hypothetical protein
MEKAPCYHLIADEKEAAGVDSPRLASTVGEAQETPQ